MKQLLNTRKTSPVNVLPGCTSRVQVIDVLMSKPFKDEVPSLSEDHLDKNLDQYVDDTINASQPRVLMTKWVGGACSKVGKMKDSIIRSFKKCGLSVALDGCENDEVSMRVCRNIKCHQPLCKIMNMYWMMKMNLKKKMKIRVTRNEKGNR